MTGTGLQAWHVSVFVTAAIVLIEVVVYFTLKLRGRSRPAGLQGRLYDKRLRTAGLVLLVVLALGMAVAALGPSLADQLAGVTAAALAAVGVWLAFRSYQETVRLAHEIRAGRNTEDPQGADQRDPTPPVASGPSSAGPAD